MVICPILEQYEKGVPFDCEKEDCAWWVHTEGCCAVYQMVFEINMTNQLLGNLIRAVVDK